MDTDKKRLLEIFRSKSVNYGKYSLASGKTSNYYIDCKETCNDAIGVTLIGEIVFEMIKKIDKNVTAVGGLEIGAISIGTSTIMAALKESYLLKSFTVRKEPKQHGRKKQVEGNLGEGDNVIILDDVITTGSSTIRAVKAVEKLGANIVMVICLVDRGEGGAKNIKDQGYNMQSIFTVNDLLDAEKIKGKNKHATASRITASCESRVFQAQFI